jgi:hypothetical protein
MSAGEVAGWMAEGAGSCRRVTIGRIMPERRDLSQLTGTGSRGILEVSEARVGMAHDSG